MLGRQQELDAAGARADQRHGGTALARENAGLQRLEAAQESIDRFDRDGVLARARHAGGVRRRANIEREEIVRDRRSRAADHAAPGEIEIDHLVLIKPRPREPGERTGIDMRVIESVVTGNQSGQHPGIGRVHLAADQGEAHARNRLHAEHAQHRHVRVAGAEEHDILEYGMAHRFHADLSRGDRSAKTEGMASHVRQGA